MKITVRQLRSCGACPDCIQEFTDTFGPFALVTLETCQKAIDADMDLDWLAKHLFDGPAWAEYERVRGAAFYAASLIHDAEKRAK